MKITKSENYWVWKYDVSKIKTKRRTGMEVASSGMYEQLLIVSPLYKISAQLDPTNNLELPTPPDKLTFVSPNASCVVHNFFMISFISCEHMIYFYPWDCKINEN